MRTLIAALALLTATPALAGQAVVLKPQSVAAGPVTLGDLFDGAGKAASVIIGPSARDGGTVVLDAGQVQRVARAAGLDWDNASGLRRIIVYGAPATEAPVAAPAAPRVETAALRPETAAPRIETAKARAGATAQVLTYARNINAGDIVQADDLTWGEVPAFQAGRDAPRDADAVIGKAARKPLRAGAAVAVHDLTPPQVIKRDDVVLVSFKSEGITLTLQAKALDVGVLGEPVKLQNTATKKVIDAIATGPDRAAVGPEADRIRAGAAPTPLALR